jgi:hypothetical protein
MIYALLIVGIIIAYLMFQAKSQRNEWIDKYGVLPEYLKNTIKELKAAYPNHEISKETSEDIVINCFGPSHNWIIFFNWIPDGLAIRLEYSDMLSRKITKSIDFNPEDYNVKMLSDIMMGIIHQQ